MVFVCVCFPGPTPSSDYGSTTLPPNAAGTTFTCTTATPSTPPSSLLSGTSRSLCVDRLSWSHICFLSISNIAKYLVFWAWKSLRHHFSHMIFNLSIETQTKDVFFFTARDETRLRGGIYKPVNRIHFLFHQKKTLLHFRTAWHSTTCQLPTKTSITDSESMLNLTFVVLFQWSNCSRALWKRDSPRGGVSVRLRPAALLQWRCLQPDRLQHFLQVREARH